ncbi:bifunctional 2-polyprenyl-6-hydroxyphenol methylase/3-demethylubiquinol 3-O-methyltransferase UbiG [Acidisoma sp. L85]|uniref:class I SAM-dependent methyltransferase n=1 Tax=Acidisoma sp. L85 TaxID=1641850 RepID=UPI001C2046CC|nr:class I SAM-dependent methyltransferase [Acidisoma sp. L85]
MLPYNELVKLTQVDPNLALWDDRAEEVAGFFKISKDDAIEEYRLLNVDLGKKPPGSLFIEQSHSSVIKSYLDPIFLRTSITRLMLKYDRFNQAYRVLTAISRDRQSSDYSGLRVIDYGCGAADYSLMFAALGARPVLVDIGGGPIEFASYRMQRRNISYKAIAVTSDREYPALPKVDIINATEVLEHVLDPPFMLQRFAQALNPNGYFTFSDYPLKAKSVGGAHLKAAAELREATLDRLNRLFIPVWADPSVGYVYRPALTHAVEGA